MHISSWKRISARDLGKPRGRQGLLDYMEAQDHFDSRVRWRRLAEGSGERQGRAGRGISIAPRARNLSFLAPDSNDSPRPPLPPSPPSRPPPLPLDLWRGKWKTASSDDAVVATPSALFAEGKIGLDRRSPRRRAAYVESARSMKNNQGHLSLPTSCRS